MVTHPYFQQFISNHSIKVVTEKTIIEKQLVISIVKIKEETFISCFKDEYNYYNEKNQSLCFYLMLIALLEYEDSTDYLHWCAMQNITEVNNHQLRSSYQAMSKFYDYVNEHFKELLQFVSPYEYQTKSGEFIKLF